jgi:hypothetical protein
MLEALSTESFFPLISKDCPLASRMIADFQWQLSTLRFSETP